ncbi:hypothetical protein [Azorhizobium caulinodans]|uniref:hypothetical protein n=1 Tax=Azorhizobium caulinodans TaxID=7 RepID=UPI002FBEF3DA
MSDLVEIIRRAMQANRHSTLDHVAREVLTALSEAGWVVVPKATQDDFITRLAMFFDCNETAGSFCAEDGDGGFVAAVSRMADEIDRLRAPLSKKEG